MSSHRVNAQGESEPSCGSVALFVKCRVSNWVETRQNRVVMRRADDSKNMV